MFSEVVNQLINNPDYAVRLKTYSQLLELEFDTKELKNTLANLKENSVTISQLLYYLRDEKLNQTHVYNKWLGAHWILSSLADLKYPSNDAFLKPGIEKEFEWLLSDDHWERKQMIDGRKRFCASQEGNAIYSIISLGFFDERIEMLVKRLVDFQWPDGGWNCDKKPNAINSSYHESLIPLRALLAFREYSGNLLIEKTIDRACEVFLKRKLFKGLSTNEVIDPRWLKLIYPSYWHYDIFMALKVLAEGNRINDKRVNEALEILESKMLTDKSFPIEYKYYQTNDEAKRYFSPTDWGEVSKKKMNPWMTIDALFILKKAKKIDIEY
ncbi:MAG: hypothetical protein FK734_01585 [Asgard group archaeon]|nr:hypothetical protein [Asgard group archaeon]